MELQIATAQDNQQRHTAGKVPQKIPYLALSDDQVPGGLGEML